MGSKAKFHQTPHDRDERPSHRDMFKIYIWASVLVCVALAGAISAWGPSLDILVIPFGAQFHPEHNIRDGETFEYIVVGAGAAGGVAAARLAASGRAVLLTEAGGRPGLLTRVPGTGGGLIGSAADYYYSTQPNNRSCLSSRGRFCRFSRGRVLGGSTAINLMMYTRGHPADYDFGLPGWTWHHIRPYFLRSEALRDLDRLPASSAPYHNENGVVPIAFLGESGSPWPSRIMKGFNTLNVPTNPDLSAESQIGVSRVLSFTSGGERVNTAEAYLQLPGLAPQLRLSTGTVCVRVLLDAAGTAHGVEVSRSGQIYRLYAQREVILTAGAIGSAEILLRSGIGPSEHLRRHKITPRVDLPVGEGLVDHVATLLFIAVNEEDKSPFATIFSKLIQGGRWLVTRGGPLATSGLSDLTAFLNTECYDFVSKQLRKDHVGCERPTIQYIHAYLERGFLSLSVARALYERVTRHEPAVVRELEAANERSALLVVTAVVLRPQSRGHLRLASADASHSPLISPNYLDDERDVEEAVRAIAILEDLTLTPEYKMHNASILRLQLAQCEGQRGDDYWRCYVRHMTLAVHHATGTAALGRVADARGRVRHTRRLRVADMSLLPHPPAGNTAAAALALAEQITDFVLQDNHPMSDS